MGKSGNIIDKNTNGIIPRSLLLREGSYYWYLDAMKGDNDSLKITGDEYISNNKWKKIYKIPNKVLPINAPCLSVWNFPRKIVPCDNRHHLYFFGGWLSIGLLFAGVILWVWTNRL